MNFGFDAEESSSDSRGNPWGSLYPDRSSSFQKTGSDQLTTTEDVRTHDAAPQTATLRSHELLDT